MAYQLIPLLPSPNQTFNCTLKVNGGKSLNFKFFLRFNEIARYWTMDIADSNTGDSVLNSIPLVPGDYPAGNILSQYDYLMIGSAYLIRINDFASQYPDAANLGTDWALVWSDNE